MIPQICSLAEVSVLFAREACDSALKRPVYIRTFATFSVQISTVWETYAADLCNPSEATSYLLCDPYENVLDARRMAIFSTARIRFLDKACYFSIYIPISTATSQFFQLISNLK